MSKLLKRNALLLNVLQKAPVNARKAILVSHLNKDFVNCICECVLNLLQGNVPLTTQQKINLQKRKKHLRLLASKKTSLRKKKELIQNGGFLGAILGPIVGVLGNLLGLNNNNNGAR